MITDRRDSGSIVIGWLTKLIVIIAVLGVMLFDALSVTAADIGAKDDASQAATVAVSEWRTSHNVQMAYQAALDSLSSDSEQIPARDFVVNSDGSVQLVLQRTVKTLLVHRIGPLKHYAVVTAHGEASAPAP
jgi:hypothetical protein